MTHHTHCDFHLGDNLAHLHFLRGLAKKYPFEDFTHAVHLCHVAQLADAISDLKNISLIPITCQMPGSIDAWKNAGGFWESHPLKNDYSAFYLNWFEHLAMRMGLDSPFCNREDLLFDYPAIQTRPMFPSQDRWDFLVVNSQPCSGQFMECRGDTKSLDGIIGSLAANYSVITTQPSSGGVPCTQDHHLTISQIGNLSLRCSHIVMISTGPSWPTFNIWNKDTVKFRLILSDNELLNLSHNTVQVRSTSDAASVLAEKGFI